tara:strand:- start:170 stop:427 length:258 start_codon:yes stop_codon:yes gene_type:complete
MKTYSRFLESSLDDKLDKYVSNEIKKRKLARFPVNATDDYKMKKGKPAFKFPSPTGEMMIHVWLRPMAKPAKSHTKAFNYQLEDK